MRDISRFIIALGPDAGKSLAVLITGPRGEPRVAERADSHVSEALDDAFARQPMEVKRVWLGRIKEAIEVGQ